MAHAKGYSTKYYQEHPEFAERMREKGRRLYRLKKRDPEWMAKEQLRNRKRMKGKKHNRKADPVKRKARSILTNALAAGKIAKPKCCSRCGSRGVIHGHHPDYAKPLNVVWLCSRCHGRTHWTV